MDFERAFDSLSKHKDFIWNVLTIYNIGVPVKLLNMIKLTLQKMLQWGIAWSKTGLHHFTTITYHRFL